MCDNCQLAKKRIEFESLMKTAKELTRQARDMMVRAAMLKSEIIHEEAQRRLRLVK